MPVNVNAFSFIPQARVKTGTKVITTTGIRATVTKDMRMEASRAMEDMVVMATMEITQQVIMDMGAPTITVSIELIVSLIHECLRYMAN